MKLGLNFRTIENQERYYAVYDESLKLVSVPYTEVYVTTSYGDSHVLCCGNQENPPLVLLHAASCGSVIWYQNLAAWSAQYCVYAIDLIGESSKSILTKKLKTPQENANWLQETIAALGLDHIYLCGLSIGGWAAANYAGFYPAHVIKLVLLSPVQTFARMHSSYFIKIMRMGFHPTRENVERYIGWGGAKEEPLPDSIIEQFTLSVMNMNANASFPSWLKKAHLKQISQPVLVLFGEQEFAFSIAKAKRRAMAVISDLELDCIRNASHLLPVSKPELINQRILEFFEGRS